MTSRLQEEIKQNRAFPSRRAEAMLSVMRTASVLEHEMNEALRPFGVTHTQYNVLRILAGSGDTGLCGRAVGERLIAKVPDVSRLLDRMHEMGLIRRERDPADRRHVTASISDEGRRVVAESRPRLDELLHRRFGALDERSVDTLVDALSTVRDAG